MERPVRIGIIGCGQIAQIHLQNYSRISGVEIVACADIDAAAAESTAATFSIPNVYYRTHELLQRDDLDAVDVCLHNNLHMPATVAALERGFHVYCEKPMAGSYRDAVTMLECAREKGKMLHIQLGFLYSDETRAAKELIDSGLLGEIYHARSTGFRRRGRPYVDGYGKAPFVQKAIAGGGALYDMGVYHISQLLYLLGNPKVERITGKTYQKLPMDEERRRTAGYSVEELAMGFVRFEGDLTMDIIEAWAIELDGFEGSSLVGTKGGIRLQPFGYYHSVGDLDLNATANLSGARFRWNSLRGEGELFGSSQQHWIAALQGRVSLLPTAEIALNTMLISEGIYLSAERGEEVTAEEVKALSKSTALPL
ncbi:predicted dehydrogenase [Chthonomonas calidirosea]|uniref:Gfo/Idh/MocA family protein n=1 Tax=Chthonomonas calidirosea TaxID=454171 RepID=UPI0006DD5087|nr:Gfo/Idh/MocA family oxidoreductase [Chthonomonas calidirosea]CEK14252.1 predicted dehydrogenase [Chthonomonas calidirosea]CEK14253.1 predicted dehydrogenase [Chthonomonas calidirosea]